jgi:hypothetical protein
MALLVSCVPAPVDSDVTPETTPPSPPLNAADMIAPSDELSPTPSPAPIPTPAPHELEPYSGPFYHVFYHFLIAFPEIAKNNSYGINLDNDTVTPTEFWRSLEELYRNDFVLIDINRYIGYDENGKVKLAQIMVPIGKKPLIMSFDDINYYSKNHGKGIADKIILDDDGNFAMLTYQPDGAALITYDNCVVPLLEQFIEQHPGFSPFGDKGLLAITGFDGILGYRTQRDSPGRDAEIEAVKPVVDALKARGWSFASHSYGHIHSSKVGIDRVKRDTQHWQDEVASIVGDTKIYVFPYGEYTKHSEPEFRHLIDSGFVFFCGVGMPPFLRVHDGYIFMDRQNVDGFSLRNRANWLEPLMDNLYVFCPEERPRPFYIP